MIAACKHGQLARSCEICDLEQQLAAAPDMLAALKAVQASRPGTLIADIVDRAIRKAEAIE